MDEYKEEGCPQGQEELEQIVFREQKERLKRKKRKKRIIILLCIVFFLLIVIGTLGVLVYKYSVVDQTIHKGFWARFDFTEGDNQLEFSLEGEANEMIFKFFTERDGLNSVDPSAMPWVCEYFGVEGEEELKQFREKFFTNCHMESNYAFWLDYDEVTNQILEEATGNGHNVKEAYIVYSNFNDEPITFLLYDEYGWKILPLKETVTSRLEEQTKALRAEKGGK